MSQKLILPINNCKLTASYKTDAYRNKFGITHYGADLISLESKPDGTRNRTVYASGDGVVVGAARDNVVGNVLIVRYNNVVYWPLETTMDIVIRYFHLASINVKLNDKVSSDTVLGIYGNTGSLKMDPHLHIEVDTDVNNPTYSPTVKSSNFIKGTAYSANDKTMTNPLEWLYVKEAPPDNQSWSTANDNFIRPADKQLPILSNLPKQYIVCSISTYTLEEAKELVATLGSSKFTYEEASNGNSST